MSAKPNYFKLGLFVIFSTVLFIVLIVIFGSGMFFQEKIYFETYFNTSISGLSVGSIVEDMGVRKGVVERIAFVTDVYDIPEGKDREKYYNYVMAICSAAVTKEQRPDLETIEADLERIISKGFRLQLASNIVTGKAYLEGEYLNPDRFPVLEIAWEPKYHYIPSAPGNLSTFRKSLDDILYKFSKVETEKIAKALNNVLDNINTAVVDSDIPQVSAEVKNLFAEARQTNRNLNALLKSPQADREQANIAKAVIELNKVLERIDMLIATQQPQIERSLENFRQTSRNVKDLSGDIKKNPSTLIFSKPPPESEVLR
ncbi:MAG: MlaD family protein [Planctomycetota bacterium]|jgi:paraquat-inducible protein B